MGEMSNTVSVICPDYSKLLEEGIKRHLSDKQLTDVVFNCDGYEIHAHRLMISIFVPDLMNKLENSSELANLNLNSDSLPSIIDFIYNGRVEVASKQLTKLKKDAEMLEFELLADTIDFVQTTMKVNDTSKSNNAKKIKSKGAKRVRKTENKAVETNEVDAPSSEQQNINEDQTEVINVTDDVETTTLRKKSRPIVQHDRLTYIRCPQCAFETPSESSYLKHLNTEHGVDAKKDETKITYRCYRCDFTTEDRVKWHTHRTIESRRGNYNCSDCDKVFHYKILLDRHIQYNHSTNRPYHCDQCEYKGTTYGLLKDHKKVHKNGSFLCSSCDMVFKLKSYLVRHTLQQHAREEERTFHCHLCSKRYVRRCDLNKHIRDFHRITPPNETQVKRNSRQFSTANLTVPESCHHCDFKTKHSKTLWIYHLAAKHQEDVEGNRLEPNIKCDQCDRTFCIDLQLYNHRMTMHRFNRQLNGEEKPYMCETCGHRTKFKHQLTVHRKTHSSDRFRCEICDKLFKSKLNLKRHIGFMHNPNAKCHVCHICSFATKRKSLLREHIARMHKDTVEQTLDNLIVKII